MFTGIVEKTATLRSLVRSGPDGPFISRPHSGGGDLAAVAPSGEGFVVVGEDGAETYAAAGGESP